MTATLLLEYPELPLASLLGLGLLLRSRQTSAWHCPSWLAEPAIACLSLAPQRYLNWVKQSLVHANWRDNLSFGDFASCKLYAMLSTLLLTAFLSLPMVLLIAAIVWSLPDLVLLITVKRRQQSIRTSLPQALDLMILCVDAGMGLDAALKRVTSDGAAITSALNDELKLLAGEILLGGDRDRAYEALYLRTGVDELRTLGSAMGQATKLGLSIARILRAQSEFICKKQSQRAEERALKIPIIMAFPLWFFIMPSLMLLVLGPSLINFYHQLHTSFGAGQ